jgi:hypothetical protein
MVSILSRSNLELRGIGFNRDNTTELDIELKGYDDVVFFALEAGEKPAKLKSRFGKTLYRIPFNSLVFSQVAWGALDDLVDVNDQKKESRKHFPWLTHLEMHEVSIIFAIEKIVILKRSRHSTIFLQQRI